MIKNTSKHKHSLQPGLCGDNLLTADTIDSLRSLWQIHIFGGVFRANYLISGSRIVGKRKKRGNGEKKNPIRKVPV